jgi:hypothetical protein
MHSFSKSVKMSRCRDSDFMLIRRRRLGPRGWRNLRRDSKVWFRVLSDSDHWVITLQIADPSSRQRGRPTETGPQISDSNFPTGSNIWSQVPQGCSISRHTDWPSVLRWLRLWTSLLVIMNKNCVKLFLDYRLLSETKCSHICGKRRAWKNENLFVSLKYDCQLQLELWDAL